MSDAKFLVLCVLLTSVNAMLIIIVMGIEALRTSVRHYISMLLRIERDAQADRDQHQGEGEVNMDTNPLDRAGFELRKWLEDEANAGKVFAWTPDDVERLLRERDEAVRVARTQIINTLVRLADEDRSVSLRDAIATLKQEVSD